jgi:hypothetical protein
MNDFNPLIYTALNNDVTGLNHNNSYKHYLDIGIKEGRPTVIKQVYNDFRTDIYLELNSDLVKYRLSDNDIVLHWLQKGRYENRSYRPKLLKNIIYLYTDIENMERCISFSNILDQLDVKYKIIEDIGVINMNSMYILFSEKNIVKYPFYYICNLLDYRINSVLLDIATAICINPENLLVPLGKYTGKVYYLKEPNIPPIRLIIRLLVGVEYLGKENMQINIEKDSINVISNLENREVRDVFMNNSSIPGNVNIIYGFKNDTLTIKHIVNEAKKADYRYIIFGNDTVTYSNNYRTNFKRIISYLDKVDNWDVFIGISQEKFKNMDVIELIQIDKDTELFRIDKIIDFGYCIINKKAYDKLLNNKLELDILGSFILLV